VVDGEMRLNELGKICEQQIKYIEQSRSYVEIHEYVVMPNHIHILLILGIQQPLSNRRGESIIRPIDDNIERSIIRPMNIDIEQINNKEGGSEYDNKEGGLTNRPYEGPSLSSIVKLFK
jgi:hypothetical protein